MNYKYYNPRKAALDTARELLTGALNAAVADGSLPEAPLPEFIVEIPADVKNGDIASNAAMAGARAFHKAPRQIAQAIVDHLNLEGSLFDRAEIAGPGFINLFLGAHWFTSVLQAAATEPEYGRTDGGAGKRYNVEFVSANPTGPMHMGNARGGALGDRLAACLDWAGYDVTREFYINDAGNQIQKFGKSLAIRYLQLYKGEEAVPLPEECYQGADIIARAKEFAEIHGDSYVDKDFEELKDALIADALPKNIAALKRDLGKYRITYDVWFHESDLHKSGAVDGVIKILMDKGACYKAEDGAIMYRSAQYASKYGVVNRKKDENADGEEEAKDEVLVRANGIPTYFAADIAYHYNKLAVRGFDRAIDIWGADHHGHVARMKGAMDAVGLDGTKLDVVLMQMVNLMRDGKPVRMSKRTGKAISLTDLLDEIPVDACRYFFNAKPETQMEFDLGLAVREDSENPVYYVQYAHARICTLLKALEAEGYTVPAAGEVDFSLLSGEAEQALIKKIAAYSQVVRLAARDYDPSHINRYLTELAGDFHRFYTACRIKGEERPVLLARLKLADTARSVLKNAMTLIGCTAPEKM